MVTTAYRTKQPVCPTLPSESLFDNTIGYDDEVGVRLAQGLSPEEVKQATVYYNLFNELWGVCIVIGDPGTGKDLFGNYLTYNFKRFYPWKRIWRDEKPRELYGPYAGLFNPEVLHDELSKMMEVATGVSATKLDVVLERAADEWVSSTGEVMLKNSVLYLTEYWRYCYNREPHKPMNKTMGGIHKVKRHLDCFILGTVQMAAELDKKTCLPWIDWRVTCTRSKANRTCFTFLVEKVKYDRRENVLYSTSKPFPISFDAAKPRSNIGSGKIIVRKPIYAPQTEDERVVLAALQAGVDNYEELVELFESKGDMCEWEVLATLKELMLRKTKRVIDYPCYFKIYNSKSAPQLPTSVGIRA